MKVKIVYTIQELFNEVTDTSIYLSDPVGTKEDVSGRRIADVIPLLKDDESAFNRLLYEAGARVLREISAFTDDVDYPYRITDNTDPEFPLSVVFEVSLDSTQKEGVVVPLLQQAITEAITYYIIKEWLKLKGYGDYALIYEKKYEDVTGNITEACIIGKTSTKTYNFM